MYEDIGEPYGRTVLDFLDLEKHTTVGHTWTVHTYMIQRRYVNRRIVSYCASIYSLIYETAVTSLLSFPPELLTQSLQDHRN